MSAIAIRLICMIGGPGKRMPRGIALGWFAIACCVGLASPAHAGNGSVNAGGTIDVTVNLRFPPSAPSVATLQTQMTEASHVLYDATEGQLQLGQVTIQCGSMNEDLADYWAFAQPIRSNSCVDCLGVLGGHVSQYFGDAGPIWAHEFGHLGFGLSDEYTESQTNCGGVGWCIEETPPAFTERNQCLMQQSPGVSWTEFCGATNHDSLRGNNTACKVNPPDPDGAPCMTGCERWNTTTHLYETSSQEADQHRSCWQSLVAKFPFLAAPAGLPVEAEPGGFVAPTFANQCNTADTVLLLLDRSGSMAWNVNSDTGEVCGNGVDDDGDGTVDETDDCAQARIEFVRAAARSFLQLAGAAGVRAGIVSFNDTATTNSGFVDLGTNLPSLLTMVDGLAPGGMTAISTALSAGKALFDADPAANGSKAALIITDGVNTAGPDPTDPAGPVPAYRTAGIRIYSISTGDASNSATLTSISTSTRGSRIDSRDGTALVTTAVESFANYTKAGVVVPQIPYAVASVKAGLARNFSSAGLPPSQKLTFDAEKGTKQVTVCLAGNMNQMGGFGVRALLRAPGGTVFDSQAPGPQMRVVNDRYFTLVTLLGPEAGRWELEVQAAPNGAPVQTGKLIVISDNPDTKLFADLSSYVVTDPSATVDLTLFPFYFTGLRGVGWDVTMTRPDGVVVPLAIVPGRKPETHRATLSGFPYSGLYEVRATMRRVAGTTNDPGESRPGVSPPNTIAVPDLERTARLYLFADVDRWYCPPGRIDCDGDGVAEGAPGVDSDGDFIPDAIDHDSNNDEVPDGKDPTVRRPGHDVPCAQPCGWWWRCCGLLLAVAIFIAFELALIWVRLRLRR